MSHTTKIAAIKITDVAAIRQAVAALQTQGIRCSLEENARPRMYTKDQEVLCDYVLRIPDAKYDVGFQKQEDGTYQPLTDPYEWSSGSVRSVLGNAAYCALTPQPANRSQEEGMRAIGLFAQEYGKAAAINVATAQGYYVESAEYDKEGNLQLVLAN